MHCLPRIHGLTALASVVLLGALPACGDPPPAFPQEDFEVLTLERSPGLGFCPEQGTVLDAEIRRNADGTATFSGQWAAAGDPATGDCSPTLDFCLVREPFGPQALTAAQVADLQAAIARVDRKECDEGNIQCDPCLFTRLSVDGAEVSDACCGDVNGGFAGPFDALAAQIDTLVARSAR